MYYVTWYAVLGVGFFLGLMVFRGAVLYWWCMVASQRWHSKSVHRVLYAPLGFFLTVRAAVRAVVLWCLGSPGCVFQACGHLKATEEQSIAHPPPPAHPTCSSTPSHPPHLLVNPHPHPNPPNPQTPVGDLLVSFTKDQDVLDEALPDALYYTGIYGASIRLNTWVSPTGLAQSAALNIPFCTRSAPLQTN
jgi:hypothetical protein